MSSSVPRVSIITVSDLKIEYWVGLLCLISFLRSGDEVHSNEGDVHGQQVLLVVVVRGHQVEGAGQRDIARVALPLPIVMAGGRCQGVRHAGEH